MARTPRDVTDAELSVLRILWDRGPVAVREIARIQSEAGPVTQAATVQKLLERLEDKGWVTRDRTGPVQLFQATADRDDLIGQVLRDGPVTAALAKELAYLEGKGVWTKVTGPRPSA